jgi:hypothetical protein
MPEAARVRIGPADTQFTRVPSGPREPSAFFISHQPEPEMSMEVLLLNFPATRTQF